METFSTLPLSAPLAKAIHEMGFTKPSPIQAETLPILLDGPTDFIGLAATGTGKTAAFGIPLLERIDAKKRSVQALVLCPTRELSMQVSGQINQLGKHMGVQALAIYGGASYDEQFRGLKRGVQVVVGTPGRIIDHLERGTLKLDELEIVVLDEADEMISMGFREDMETILESAPRESSNTWLFSATMSSSVRKVADEFLSQPRKVEVNRTEMLSSTVEQYFYMTQEKNKPDILCKLIDAADDFYGIVFCQTKVLVVDLVRFLSDRGYKVDSLHGDMTQAAREQVMAKFRARSLKVLVCTDVAARGLDVKDITHVINFSIPRELDSYVHRIGRTARSGKNGVAMSLVTPSHKYLLQKVERMTKSKIHEGVIPTRRALATKKVARVLDTVLAQKNHTRAMELLEGAWAEAIAGMSKEEVAGRFLSMMFPEVFADELRPQMARTPREQPKEGFGGRPSPTFRPSAVAPRATPEKPSRPVPHAAGPRGSAPRASAPRVAAPRGMPYPNNKKVNGNYPPRRGPK